MYDCKTVVENVTSLDLSNNNITSVDVDSFAMFYELRYLNLSNNRISLLDNNTFYPLRKLESLDVSYNSLTKLDGGLIRLFNLRSIWFNNNNISQVDPNIVGQENVALVYFNLNNNSLTYLDPWPYTTYQTYQRRVYREFFIQHNKISELTNYMNWTYNLKYPFEVELNLQWNELKTITTETIRQYDHGLSPESLFAAFLTFQANVTHNPFFCDCKLFDITDTVRRGIFRYTKVEEYRYRCGSPTASAGIDFLHDLDYDQFVCNVTTDCPSGCFCQDRPYNDTYFIDCKGAGLTEMPDVIPNHSRSKLEINLDNNAIVSLKNTSYLTNIYNISLVGNRLSDLDENILSVMNASRMDFRNNKITKLPRAIKKFSYSSVSLSGNPLECDCQSMWLSEWIKLDSEEGDISLTCDSKTGTHTIADISLKVLGCTNEWIIILCACLGVVLALMAIVLVFAKRCPYETRVLLFKIFRIRSGKKYEVDGDDQKEVDIYIVFDDMCEDVIGWVRYFLKKLNRKKPIYSVLNPARFMEPGSESVNIPKWIGRSKRMIIVLSDKIFENEWRCFEIEDAEKRIIEATARQNGKIAADKRTESNNIDDKSNDDNTEESCRIDIENDNDSKNDDVNNDVENEPCDDEMEGDENLEKAPKIIYIIFNSSDLLQSKLDEDKWIERIGDRRNMREKNPKEFDLRAKKWQEKLQEEPWKSRLAGKVVLSPDDRLFWSKLRYELPPEGNGKGDGNFTFKNPDRQEDMRIGEHLPRQDRDRNDINATAIKQNRKNTELKFTHFENTSEKARVHKSKHMNTKSGRNNLKTKSKGDPSARQTTDPKQILNILKSSTQNAGVFSIAGNNEGKPKIEGLENNHNTGSSKPLLDLLEKVDIGFKETCTRPKENTGKVTENFSTGTRVNKDLVAAVSKNENSPKTSRPGSGAKINNADPSSRIFTIGGNRNGLDAKLTNILGYSSNLRNNNGSATLDKNMGTNLSRKNSSFTLHSELSDLSLFSDA